MAFAAITGWGMAVPQRVVTNEELARTVAVDPAWIAERTGILERRYAAPQETTSSLATVAARAALARAKVAAEDIDLVVVATTTPDRLCPATAPLVQASIGATAAGAFDVNAACAGFLTAAWVATGLIASGGIHRALVVGAEILSRFVDPADPRSCVLFGDGAGAVVLERSDEPAGILAAEVGADGTRSSLIAIPAGGAMMPASAETVAARAHFIRLNGPEVYRAAVRTMVEAAEAALRRARCGIGDVDLFIAHQANARIVAECGARLGLPPERVFSNVARYGNTSAASIPIALYEAAEEGLLERDATVLVSAVGAGLTSAGAVVRWAGVKTAHEERRVLEGSIS